MLRRGGWGGDAAAPASSGTGLAEFDRIYRSNVGVVTAYFARRSTEPQRVADLTAETFLRAAAAFGDIESRKTTPRAWLFGIAARVDAQSSAQTADGLDANAEPLGHRALGVNEIQELVAKIDAERAGRGLMECCARLPAIERAAIELVDLAGLAPEEAAAALGVYRGVLRLRLSRARTRLAEEEDDVE